MSLGIRLLAHLSRPSTTQEELIVQMESWLRLKYSDMLPRTRREVVDSTPTLFCRMHPAAEEFELSFVGPSQLVASANTTTVGPGYHVFLTSVLKDLAHEFHARWVRAAEDSEDYGDETGYFFTGDEKRLNAEMMSWLAALAKIFFDGSLDPDDRGIALCLPMNPQFEVEQPASTPLGPRDREWLHRTAQDGGSGTDFFAWWTPGFNAEYYLGRALAQMWTDVRWRPPISESETLALEDVAGSLRRAYELNPSLRYPWAEWKQVLELLNRDGAEAELVNSRVEGEPTIGYRRKEVTVALPGGWGIKTPGSFSDFEPDDDNDLCAIDPPREIWFTAYRFEAASSPSAFESVKNDRKKSGADYLIERDDYFAQATISNKRRETGEEYFVLNSSNLAIGTRAVCTILFSDPDQEDWAVETWQSIQPPPTSEP
ncbi:MAG TPA: hypothetical protein VN776_15495 [Terracidiphilus sp.]|nr:hypothetical protein [Terracidiphilus sp.]